MKIIIPAESKDINASVCPSFGRAPFYVFYNTEDDTSKYLDNEAAESQGGAGIKAAQMIVDTGAQAVITYRLGENAAQVLNAADIRIYKAKDGTISENIRGLKNQELSSLSEIHPGFHGHKGGNR